jgi:hypothetical protein
MKTLIITIVSFFLSYNCISQKGEYLGLTYKEVLKKEGAPIDIIVQEGQELSEDFPEELREKASIAITTILIYDYDKSYFFNDGVVTGYGYGFTNEEEKINAKKEFEKKYTNK